MNPGDIVKLKKGITHELIGAVTGRGLDKVKEDLKEMFLVVDCIERDTAFDFGIRGAFTKKSLENKDESHKRSYPIDFFEPVESIEAFNAIGMDLIQKLLGVSMKCNLRVVVNIIDSYDMASVYSSNNTKIQDYKLLVENLSKFIR